MTMTIEHPILSLIKQKISSGLSKKAMRSASQWAERCRIMPSGLWTFRNHPWLKDMHDSEAEQNYGMKSAQMGYTECVLNLTFYNIDTRGFDCLYVLPSKTPGAKDFSAARFNPALELSPYLRNLFSDVQNIGHKRAGTSNLYIRGSKSRSGLKEIPTAFIVLDEVDEMPIENIPLALERSAGQMTKQAWLISTPTTMKSGISTYYSISTQEHFFFRCLCCSRMTEMVFPECLEITGDNISDPKLKNSFYKCKECGGKLDHNRKVEWWGKNEWVKGRADADKRGFHINQMYSPTITPYNIATAYFMSLRDPSAEQELYNSKLGLPHAVSGSQLTDADINACMESGHKNGQLKVHGGLITMGIDVGKKFHYEVDQWFLGERIGSDDHVNAECRVLEYGEVDHISQIDQKMQQWQVHSAVIDANPENRLALAFCNRYYGRARRCFYGNGVNGRNINFSKDDDHAITVDRTSWLDSSLGRIRAKMIYLPYDTTQAWREHLKALIRVYKKDRDGNPVGRYDHEDNEPDHYAHARNYAEIALSVALRVGEHGETESPI